MVYHTLFFLFLSYTLYGSEVSHTVKKLDDKTQQIAVNFTLKPGDYLYKESLVITADSLAVTLTSPVPSVQPVSFFDTISKKQRLGYKDAVTFSLTATKQGTTPLEKARLHAQYRINTNAEPQHASIDLPFDQPKQQATPRALTLPAASQERTTQPAPSCEPPQPSLIGSFVQKTINAFHATVAHTKQTLSSLFSTTGSPLLRFFAAFLLGVLLSLTPCIYPMIPITVGILGASGTSSAFKNFLLAAAYTLGISTTFALLGLIAALGSCVFGELQGSPLLIVPLALLLIYFGLSMFDIIQLRIPSFLQPKTKVKGGSLFSAYLFGAVSGTVASPCLSPGLVLILNYVAHRTEHFTGYLEGLVLLFIFGVGSSLPLLIIGTFSGSLHVLPRAGQWMVEIKKLVGIMLISMAFYHLTHLERWLPWHILVWFLVLAYLALGIYYFSSIKAHEKKWMHRYKNGMGTALIVGACILMLQGEKAVIDHMHPISHTAWLHDYDKAHAQALKAGKHLFIDIGATYCSTCVSFDKRIFTKTKIEEVLKNYVQLKINSDVDTKSYEQIKALHGSYIEGFPTYLVVDPRTNTVLKKWSIDIDDLSIEGLDLALESMQK